MAGSPNEDPVDRRMDVDAASLCLAVRHLALLEFAAEAGDVLAEWNLGTKQGVGCMVEDMIRHGLIRTGYRFSMEQYSSPQCPDPWPAPVEHGGASP